MKLSGVLFLLTLVLALLGWYFVSRLLAAPSQNLWPRWQSHRPESKMSINHEPFQIFLTHYLYKNASGINLVHYAKVTSEDKKHLADYLNNLSNIPISQYNRKEQLAYWINLYNALTIQLIVSHWPVKSITKLRLSPGFFSFGPWDAKLITVEGQLISLNDIEQRILRPIWQDARVHYALNCASMSCPQLQPHPFTGATANLMMNKAAKEYVNGPQGITLTNKALILSQIYQWYQTDFGANEKAVLYHIAKFAKPELKQLLLTNQKPIHYHYDWQVNGD